MKHIEAKLKFEAIVMLLESRRRFVIPTKKEWIGVNLLERDGDLQDKWKGQSEVQTTQGKVEWVYRL